jgi:hypothetical protein
MVLAFRPLAWLAAEVRLKGLAFKLAGLGQDKGGLSWPERAKQDTLLRRDLYLHASPIGSAI